MGSPWERQIAEVLLGHSAGAPRGRSREPSLRSQAQHQLVEEALENGFACSPIDRLPRLKLVEEALENGFACSRSTRVRGRPRVSHLASLRALIESMGIIETRGSPMAPSSHRILKRKGRVTLIETANPTMGVGYSVKIGTLGLWSGDDLAEAERRFEQATAQGVA